MTKPSFLTHSINAVKQMFNAKKAKSTLNESDIMILRNYMKLIIETSQNHINDLKLSKSALWNNSDVNRKDDPDVSYSYKMYKKESNFLRKQKARHQRFIQIQKKLRNMLKAN